MSDKSVEPKILDTLICEIKIFNSSKKLLKEETINMNVVIDNEGGDEKCLSQQQDMKEFMKLMNMEL